MQPGIKRTLAGPHYACVISKFFLARTKSREDGYQATDIAYSIRPDPLCFLPAFFLGVIELGVISSYSPEGLFPSLSPLSPILEYDHA